MKSREAKITMARDEVRAWEEWQSAGEGSLGWKTRSLGWK